jgi:hypothetical protein
MVTVEEPTITKSQKGAAWQVRSSTKSMLIVFFDVKGIAVYVPKETILKEMEAKIE